MKTFRAYWAAESFEPCATPRLHVVSRNAPARPRWGQLYLALIVVTAIGTGVHLVVDTDTALTGVDALFGLLLFGVLAGWIRLNRLALTRMDEPGAARLRVRIIRSQPRERLGAEGRDDQSGARVVLPFDVR